MLGGALAGSLDSLLKRPLVCWRCLGDSEPAALADRRFRLEEVLLPLLGVDPEAAGGLAGLGVGVAPVKSAPGGAGLFLEPVVCSDEPVLGSEEPVRDPEVEEDRVEDWVGSILLAGDRSPDRGWPEIALRTGGWPEITLRTGWCPPARTGGREWPEPSKGWVKGWAARAQSSRPFPPFSGSELTQPNRGGLGRRDELRNDFA